MASSEREGVRIADGCSQVRARMGFPFRLLDPAGSMGTEDRERVSFLSEDDDPLEAPSLICFSCKHCRASIHQQDGARARYNEPAACGAASVHRCARASSVHTPRDVVALMHVSTGAHAILPAGKDRQQSLLRHCATHTAGTEDYQLLLLAQSYVPCAVGASQAHGRRSFPIPMETPPAGHGSDGISSCRRCCDDTSGHQCFSTAMCGRQRQLSVTQCALARMASEQNTGGSRQVTTKFARMP